MSHRLSYVPWYRSLLLLRGLGRRLLGCSLRRWLLGRCRFGGGLLGWSGLLLRRGLLRRWLLRRLRLGLRFIGLWLLALGEDLGDAEQRQILAMPLLAAVVLAPLLLEHDDLVAARLLHHLGGNQRAGNGRATRLRAIAA